MGGVPFCFRSIFKRGGSLLTHKFRTRRLGLGHRCSWNFMGRVFFNSECLPQPQPTTQFANFLAVCRPPDHACFKTPSACGNSLRDGRGLLARSEDLPVVGVWWGFSVSYSVKSGTSRYGAERSMTALRKLRGPLSLKPAGHAEYWTRPCYPVSLARLWRRFPAYLGPISPSLFTHHTLRSVSMGAAGLRLQL